MPYFFHNWVFNVINIFQDFFALSHKNITYLYSNFLIFLIKWNITAQKNLILLIHTHLAKFCIEEDPEKETTLRIMNLFKKLRKSDLMPQQECHVTEQFTLKKFLLTKTKNLKNFWTISIKILHIHLSYFLECFLWVDDDAT